MTNFRFESAPRAFCTIITPDYGLYALALRKSLDLLRCDWPLHVLSTGPLNVASPGIRLWSLSQLMDASPIASAIAKKYASDLDRLRWSLKSVFLTAIIRAQEAESVVYCDSDMCFFEHPQPIFEELALGGTVLTPHWRPPTPIPSVRNFRLNFLDGLFNAGCVGANSLGLDAMMWWADACLNACEKNYTEGLFDDQRYLDLLPIYFPLTRILRKSGYNLADWNIHLREPGDDGRRIVPDREPVSLVHFTRNTIKHIESGRDPVLKPYLERYNRILASVGELKSRTAPL